MDSDGRTPEAWYRSLPPLTRFILTVTFVLTLASTFRLFSPAGIILDWTYILSRKLQLWRLVSDYFFNGPFSFAWLMHAYLLVTFSAKLELNELFTVSPGAYLTFLIFQVISLDILSLLLYWPTGKPLMAQSLVMAIIYYWSRREPFAQIGLWGFQMQAYQFPFALLFLDLIMGHSLLVGIMGLATGHLFYFIKDVLPQEKGIDLFKKAPHLCDELMIRAACFDFSNVIGSLKILVWGRSAGPPVASGAFPRFSTLRGGGSESTGDDVTRRLFTGPGRRLDE